MSPSELQMERLARRISWLDRFRRSASILAAVIISALLLWWFTGWFPANWPTAHVVCVAAMVGTILWYGIESVLGFALALWETDYAQLTRPGRSRHSPKLPGLKKTGGRKAAGSELQ